MEKLIICIYDKVAGVYSLFGDFANKGVCLRAFSDYLKDSKFFCSSHPEDFDIVCVGKLNVNLGTIESLCEKIANCNELIEIKENK